VDARTLDGLIVVATLAGVAGSWQSTMRWYTCAIGAAIGGALAGALLTYNAFADMPYPERGLEWGGAVISAAGWALLVGAIAGGVRDIWRARKRKSAGS